MAGELVCNSYLPGSWERSLWSLSIKAAAALAVPSAAWTDKLQRPKAAGYSGAGRGRYTKRQKTYASELRQNGQTGVSSVYRDLSLL